MLLEGARRERLLVLHIEDDAEMRGFVAVLLQRLQMDLITSAHVTEGIMAALEKMPDLVLLDAMMPGMDGFEFIRQTKKDPRFKNIPLIMITSLDQESHRDKAFKAGADGYLAKPFDADALYAAIEACFRKKAS